MAEATDARNPAKSPPDMQASVGWAHRQGRDWVQLGFLPVSHTLADDNTAYFSENELRLFDARVRVDTRSGSTSTLS